MTLTPNLGLNLPAFNTPNWDVLVNQNFQALDDSIQEVAAFDATLQGAAITGQLLVTPAKAGLYRITAYAVVTRAASTSSSVNVTVGYTDSDSGAAITVTSTAQTGNTVGAICLATFVVNSINAVNILANTTYASVGGTTMQYAVHFRVEQLN